MHDEFEPKLLSILNRFADPIADVVDAVAELRSQGIKIGGTTGYNDTMMSIVAPKAEENGYAPDFWLTPDSVHGKGRPYPYMVFENIVRLDMGMPAQVVKVGDTTSDMQEARNAGVWAVGVLRGSSMMGFTQEEVQVMAPDVLQQHLDAARMKFMESGAHFVIEDMSQLQDTIRLINEKLAAGERPTVG
jgi:phosphonoacetaldehyde hydrolase